MTVPFVPVQPVNFIIPPDIQLGLDAGNLVRYGGVVRNQLGHIVTHLKEVPVPGKEPAPAQRVLSLLRDVASSPSSSLERLREELSPPSQWGNRCAQGSA